MPARSPYDEELDPREEEYPLFGVTPPKQFQWPAQPFGEGEPWSSPAPGPTDGGRGGPEVGGGGGGMGGGFAARPQFNFAPVPQFDPGARFDPGPRPDRFLAPSFQDAQNEPGYRFRLQSGADALERSASARGTLRTGGTQKDITSWGQNFGAQEYGNVYNRARSAYDANLAGWDRAYQGNLASYDRGYQGLKDTFAPKLAQWQFLSESERAAALAQYQQAWERFQFNHLSAAQKAALAQGGGGGGPNIPPPPPPPDVEKFGQQPVKY